MPDFPNKADGPGPKPLGKRPKPQPVISGASKAQRPVMRRLRDAIVSESPRSLGAQIGKDIVVPRLKMGLQETLNSFIAGVLWGNISQQPMMGRSMGNQIRTNYSGMSSQQANMQAQQAVVNRTGGNYDDVVCPTEEKARKLLSNAIDYINEYSVMSIGDLYEMAELPSQISDQSFGWHDISAARIYQTADGFELKMPRPTLL